MVIFFVANHFYEAWQGTNEIYSLVQFHRRKRTHNKCLPIINPGCIVENCDAVFLSKDFDLLVEPLVIRTIGPCNRTL